MVCIWAATFSCLMFPFRLLKNSLSCAYGELRLVRKFALPPRIAIQHGAFPGPSSRDVLRTGIARVVVYGRKLSYALTAFVLLHEIYYSSLSHVRINRIQLPRRVMLEMIVGEIRARRCGYFNCCGQCPAVERHAGVMQVGVSAGLLRINRPARCVV